MWVRVGAPPSLHGCVQNGLLLDCAFLFFSDLFDLYDGNFLLCLLSIFFCQTDSLRPRVVLLFSVTSE